MGVRRGGRRSVLVGILVVSTLALGLRVWGVAWSLPYVDHPDEPAVMNVVLRIVGGRLDPDFFFYPSLILYLQALLIRVHLWWGMQTGLYVPALALPETTDFLTTIPAAFVWARTFTAVCGAATVGVVAAWGRQFFGTRTALLAAVLLALSPFAILHAHYVTVDVPTTLFALLALFGACQVAQRGTRRDYAVAGLLLGLAAATKYQSGFVVVSLLAAHGLRWRGLVLRHTPRLVLAGAASVLTFLLCSPFVLLNFAGFARDIRTLLASYQQAHGDVVGAWPVSAYAAFVGQELLGVLPALFAVLGLGLFLRRRPATAVILLMFPVVLAGLLLRPQTHFWRNLLPIQPPLLLIAASGAVGAFDLLRARFGPRSDWILSVLGLCLLLVPSAVAAVRQADRLALPDSRVTAQAMIRSRFPGVRVASELSHQLSWNGVSQATGVEYLPLHSADWYRAQGYGLLLASSTPRRAFAWTDAYRPLLAATRPVATYGGPGSRYRGPRVDVLDTGLTAADAAHALDARIGPLQLHGATLGRLVAGTTADTLEVAHELAAGERLGMLLFWSRVEAASAAGYTVFVHLRDENGGNLSQVDAPLWSGLFPPGGWPAGSTVVDRLVLPLPALPAGSYRLVLGVYDAATLSRFPLSVQGQRQGGDELEIGTVTIR